MITIFGEAVLYWIISAFLIFGPFGLKNLGTKLLIGTILEAIIVHVWLKRQLKRGRPFELYNDIKPLGRIPRDRSWPSGHTAMSFTCAILLFVELHSIVGILAIIFATLIAFSRVYLGVHFPTDVIGGFLIAVIINTIICWI